MIATALSTVNSALIDITTQTTSATERATPKMHTAITFFLSMITVIKITSQPTITARSNITISRNSFFGASYERAKTYGTVKILNDFNVCNKLLLKNIITENKSLADTIITSDILIIIANRLFTIFALILPKMLFAKNLGM